jgi:hypothetical protein
VLPRLPGTRAPFIAATGAWYRPAVEYAYAESVVRTLQVLVLPDPKTTAEHYRKSPRQPGWASSHGISPPPLEILTTDSVVGMKETSARSTTDIQRFGERLAIFAEGVALLYRAATDRKGTQHFRHFCPEIVARLWNAVEKKDMEKAKDIVLKYDQPLFDFCLSGKRSFHAYWRGMLEYFGVAQRHLRPPSDICTDADMRAIKDLFDGMGLRPKALPKAS